MMAAGRLCLIAGILACCHAATTNDRPTVQTKQGVVRGVRATDGDYNLFMGIPYASIDPKNRFDGPQPPPTWKGVRDTDNDNVICPHIFAYNMTVLGEPDCLVLNVYTRTGASKTKPRPVIVYIHGGGFIIGWGGRSVQGPQYYMDHDVILVTMNYRLNVYGFLCLAVDGAPGNAGFKDQVAALRWVQENIAEFGGDPKSVTIVGESAGAASVQGHIISPMSRGLFHRAILQSGTMLNPWVLSTNPIDSAIALVKQLGKDIKDPKEILKFLKTVKIVDMVAATRQANADFKPCVETGSNTDKFLSVMPITSLQSGDFDPVPILAGSNDREGMLFVPHFNLNDMKEMEKYLPFEFSKEADKKEAVQKMRKFYLGDKAADADDAAIGKSMDFVSDLMFIHGIDRSMRYHQQFKSNPIYYYVFAYDGGLPYVKNMIQSKIPGVCHADELGYLFVQGIRRSPAAANDALIVKRLTTMWTNFAIHGNPTPQKTELLPIEWKPVAEDNTYYMRIDSEMKLKKNPYNKRMKLWNDLSASYPIDNKFEILLNKML